MRRRHKKLSVEEARAMQNPADLAAIENSRHSKMDVVEAQVHCVVCGAPAKTAILRIHLSELAGAKMICPECEDKGWAWMSNMTEDGSVIEEQAISTVEEEATKGIEGDSNKVAKTLFDSTSKMQTNRQNPVASYKMIRKFEDDTLLCHLSLAKDHSGGSEGHLWKLYSDDNRLFKTL